MKKILITLILTLTFLTTYSQGSYIPINSAYWFKETASNIGGSIRISDSLNIGWNGTSFGLSIDTVGRISKYGGSTITDGYTLVGSGGRLILGPAPAATLSGLNPYEVLSADALGDLYSTPNFQWSSAFGDNTLSITGTSPSLSISDGSYGGTYTNEKVFFTDGTGAAMDIQYNMIRIIDDDNGSISIFKKDNNSATAYSLYLPPVNGTSGQSLKLNGSLELEWYTPAAGVTGLTPGLVLFGKSDGTIDQSSDLSFTPSEFLVGNLAHLDLGAQFGGTYGNYTSIDAQGVITTYYNNAINDGDIFYGSSGGMYVLPMGSANQSIRVNAGGTNIEWFTPTYGEVNTASNLGGGLANFDSKSGVDLRFNSFLASDFNLGSNLISLDYTNGQTANGSQPGFLSSADWTSFNAKLSSEVDGSTSNELQTITSTDDATSHTVTLSNSGGSFQIVEGSNITLTTSGTSSDAIITIDSNGATFQQSYGISIMNY